MSLSIKKFPHASYDPDSRIGWLLEYYAHGTIEASAWRTQTYSTELLNYKEDKPGASKYFVYAYTQLLAHVMSAHSKERAILIPVPSSVPFDSPDYTTDSKSKTGRNRDDRNHKFCKQLLTSRKIQNLVYADLLRRIKPKPPKEHWDAATHADSMQCLGSSLDIGAAFILVLVDDVYTTGGTLAGATLLLADQYPEHLIISLPIARACYPEDFRPLTQTASPDDGRD